MPTLRDLIADGRVHVVDGAMGTMLYGRGVFLNVCYDELNLRQPGLVREIHREYVRAGAELLETNTFGANPVKLARYGLADETEPINRAARLAREAAGDRAAVLGAIGPLGVRVEPLASRRSRGGHRVLQPPGCAACSRAGSTGSSSRPSATSHELDAALHAVRALQRPPGYRPDDGRHRRQDALRDRRRDLRSRARRDGRRRHRRQLLGRTRGVLEAVERMVERTDRPISAQPNAGLPREVGDRKIYLARPEYMASYARRMVEAGARFVGGCCGTTPDHIRAIRASSPSLPPRIVTVGPSTGGRAPTGRRSRSRWRSAPVGREAARKDASSRRSRSCRPRAAIRGAMFEQCRQLQRRRRRRGQRARRRPARRAGWGCSSRPS